MLGPVPPALMAVELACWIDHLIYAHPDLDAAVATLHRLFGVEASGGGNHPGRGGVEGITQGGLVEWALAVEDIEAAGTHALARIRPRASGRRAP